MLKRLPRSFYLRPTLNVAKDLLGKYLVRRIGQKRLIGRIVEVEAYRENDPASHSYHGRTKRNDVMFWKGGHLYVYFTYGMHFCANVVTREEGVGEAVLLRAVEPMGGIGVMMRRRGRRSKDRLLEYWSNGRLINLPANPLLTNGPAKLCEAFGITRKHNGVDLCGKEIWIASDSHRASHFPRVSSSPRVGIRNGRDKKWRFYVRGSVWVSRKNFT
jgi:DNA-3-methyladenine glycosylase